MKVIIITGQTATGKTEYALKLAKQHNGELINCDSRQIYKGLDIITGKDINQNSAFSSQYSVNNFEIGFYQLQATNYQLPTKIWLYDIIDPKQYFSSYDYVSCATHVIQDIFSRGKTPVIVGGTYFYLYHLLYDVETQHIKPDWKLRNRLNKKSVTELQKIFESFNLPAGRHGRLNNSDKNNPQRLIRKIEILRSNEQVKIDSFRIPKTISLSRKLGTPIQIKYIGLRYCNIDKLEDAIKKRVEKRITSGAIQEVKKLLKQGYSEKDPGLKTIGYAQLIPYLKGAISKNEAVEQWILKEQQYAKRQYVFMKKDKNIEWKEIT